MQCEYFQQQQNITLIIRASERSDRAPSVWENYVSMKEVPSSYCYIMAVVAIIDILL